MDILILTFSHGLVPAIRFTFDLLPYRSKVPVCYGLTRLGEYDFDNITVGYPFDR